MGMDLARSLAQRLGQLTHPDAVPRPFVAICPAIMLEEGEHLPWHHHRKAQLLYTLRGIVHCETADGIRIVPPQCAAWIPGDLPHSVFGSGDVECHCLFVEPDAAPGLPERCCTVAISPLMRELLRRAARLPQLYDADGADGRLVAVILDELAAAPVENLHLPVSADPRLRALAELLLARPAERASLAAWASRIALSERSLSRLLAQEVGMSFGRWRRQLHVILALQRLAAGEGVQAVAIDLGYESASSFVTMFRKAMGKPPGRYLQERERM